MDSMLPEKRSVRRKFSYGNVIMVACFLTLMITYGAIYSYGVFLKPLITEFGWTRAVIAGAHSLHFLLSGVWSILAGRLSDRFDPRLIVTCSGLLISLCYLLMSQLTAVWQLYLIYGVLLSLGAAANFVTVYSTVARWFITSRGLATGIVGAGIGVGVVVMPVLANFLINSNGWQIAFMVISGIALIIPVLAQFLKRQPDYSRKEIAGNVVQHDKQVNWNMRGLSLQQAIGTRQFWVISAMWFIFNLGIQTVFVHLVAYVTDKGIASFIAATIMSVIGLVCILGKLGFGSGLDRFRSKSMYVAIGIIMFCSFLLLQLPGITGVLYFFAVIFALSYGGFAAVQSPTIAEYFGLKAHGAIFGVALFSACLGGAIGPFITGYIFDITGNYDPAFIGCAALCLVASMLPILLKPATENWASGTDSN